MRTTVDLPDDLFRRAKSEAALQGRKLKDLVEEGLRLLLDKAVPAAEPERRSEKRKPQPGSLHELMQEWCGAEDDGPADLSTNPKYFADYGK